MGVRIALVHAVKVAIAPVEDAFRRHWPEAELSNLLDDSLSRDRNRDGALTPQLSRRIAALAQYGVDAGASAVLYTCSAFGEAIEAVKREQKVPVLRPNEAMLAEALRPRPAHRHARDLRGHGAIARGGAARARPAGRDPLGVHPRGHGRSGEG
jgi:hypothetical protein